MIQSKIICHSQAPNGDELITVEIDFHRFILAEINTHRSLSRNYQSSRAVPVDKMIDQVRNNPAIPVHFGKNQRGMVAEEETEAFVKIYDFVDYGTPTDMELFQGVNLDMTGVDAWIFGSKQAAEVAEAMYTAGYHKQIVNRILEPYIWTKGIVTGTRKAWEAVFALRCHKDAQPEFQALAKKIRESIKNSTPKMLSYGDFHLPYIDEEKHKDLTAEEKIKISTSCCGQVSYRVLDDTLEKALRIYDMLNLPIGGKYPEDPPHFSPAEHIAKVLEYWQLEYDDGGNFKSDSFWQYRKALETGQEDGFYE